MILQLVCPQCLDGEAVIFPEDWAARKSPQQLRVEVRDNVIVADLEPGRYCLLLAGLVSQLFRFEAGDEVSLPISPFEKVTGASATIEQE